MQAALDIETVSEHPPRPGGSGAGKREGLLAEAVTGFEAVSGLGAKAVRNGKTVLLGNRRFLAGEGIAGGDLEDEAARLAGEGKTSVFVAEGGAFSACSDFPTNRSPPRPQPSPS